MASFKVHLYGAATVGSTAAIGIYGLGWSDLAQSRVLFALTVVGGVLPDIDADNSVPVRVFFTLAGMAVAFFVAVSFVDELTLVEIAMLWSASFLAVRYLVFEAFTRLTVHRGIWHSLLATAFCTVAAAAIAHRLFDYTPLAAWLAGAFLGLGYLTHLVLDEAASVDLLGHRIKRSFGTALKPFSLGSPGSTAAMAGALALAVLLAPPIEPFVARLREQGLSGPSFAGLIGRLEQAWDRIHALLQGL